MFIPGNFHERRSIARSYFLLFAVPGCRRDAVTHDITTFLGGSFASSDPASLSSQPTRSKPLSIAAPPQALGLGDTCATSLCLRAGRSATMGAAMRLARLCSDLAAAVGPRLGSGNLRRARPACVFGPVDLPPWERQRALPGSAPTWQQPPACVLAPERRRPMSGQMPKSCASPSSKTP
jgi:hypothetical protein